MPQPKPPIQKGLHLLTALYLIPSLFCIGVSGYLAANGIDNWGWFLFAAVILWCVPNKGI